MLARRPAFDAAGNNDGAGATVLQSVGECFIPVCAWSADVAAPVFCARVGIRLPDQADIQFLQKKFSANPQ